MKERLDVILVERGIAASRERARALIMEGKILVNDAPVTKAGAMFNGDVGVTVRGGDIPYVSRGGLKLEAAIEHFGISLEGAVAMDVGSSTGGFTDCMLQKGAKKVYCIDVGYGQLSWSLRNDARVVLFERTNMRYFDRKKIPEEVDFVSIDVSFISLKKILPKVVEFLGDKGEILALVKPQFEVGRGEVGKGGIVRDEDRRMAAVDSVRAFAEGIGLEASGGEFRSPLPGQKGNIEFFLYLRKP